MANTDEAGPSQQIPNPNSSVVEPSKVLLDKYLNILKDFVASNDQVYMFHGNLSGEERALVDRLGHLMGLGVRFGGVASERKIYVYKMNNEASNQIQAVMSKKRKNREEPESCGEKKEIYDGLNKVWIFQTLQNFLASNTEVYNFETRLSREECTLVHEFCKKRGFIYTLSWDGIKRRVSIHKTKKEVDNTTLTENLPHVTCSAESDKVDVLRQSQKIEEPELPQHQNFIVIEPKRVQISRILENFLASEDEVYNFEDELSTKDRALVEKLSQNMGLSCTFSGRGIRKKTSVHKTKKEVDTTRVLGSLPHVTFPEESNQNKKEMEHPQHQKPVVDESTRIQISQTLENFLASKDAGFTD